MRGDKIRVRVAGLIHIFSAFGAGLLVQWAGTNVWHVDWWWRLPADILAFIWVACLEDPPVIKEAEHRIFRDRSKGRHSGS
jgi:hypothetical protein